MLIIHLEIILCFPILTFKAYVHNKDDQIVVMQPNLKSNDGDILLSNGDKKKAEITNSIKSKKAAKKINILIKKYC